MTQLADAAFDACVVAGVDSYLAPETLEWLEEYDQLHGAGPLNNAWGFIPGEAAGARSDGSEGSARELGGRALRHVLSVGIGSSQIADQDRRGLHRRRTDRRRFARGSPVCRAGAQVDRRLLRPERRALSGRRVRRSPRLRTKERFVAASDFVAPADCWGDVGAATVPLHMRARRDCASQGLREGRLSFVWASSESGERGAALIMPRARRRVNDAGHHQGQRHRQLTGPQGEQRHLDRDVPDVCKTPSPGGPVPIPYPNIAQSVTLAKGTTTVKADG